MNKRIKLLAEQAGMTKDKYGMFFAVDNHDDDGVDLEEFANLLVEEVMQELFINGHEDAFNLLNKHFGVEE